MGPQIVPIQYNNMHPEALRIIGTHIHSALQACSVQHNWPIPDSYTNEVLSLSKEVIKHKKQWLTLINCHFIFLDHVTSYLKKKFSDKEGVSGKLTELIDGSEIIQLRTSILDFIASIPRTYEIYFPLPSFKYPEINDIQLSNLLFIKKFKEGDTLPGGRAVNNLLASPEGPKKLDLGTTYVVIRASGYVRSTIDDLAFREALSSFKQLLHMCLILELIKLQEPAISWADVAVGLYSSAPQAIIIDLTNPNDISSSVMLPPSIASHIRKIILNTSSGYFKSNLNDFSNLIERNDNDAQFVKTALEWAFDSQLEENETMSFIQVSIGLEAILGEGAGREPLTETLADRCAYLLANTIENRKKLRRKFRDFYKLRSRLVHGNSTRLKDDETEFLWWGRNVLNAVIRKEIKKI